MEIEVVVGGWEHGCCGSAIALGDQVSWDISFYGGALHETHHEAEPGMTHVEGRVLGIEARFDGGRSAPITRVPSGRALNGFADDESATLVDAVTGEVVPDVAGGFRVRLRIPDDSRLPEATRP